MFLIVIAVWALTVSATIHGVVPPSTTPPVAAACPAGCVAGDWAGPQQNP